MTNPENNHNLSTPENPIIGFSVEVESPEKIYSFISKGGYYFKEDIYIHKLTGYRDIYSSDYLSERCDIKDGVIDHIYNTIYGTDEKFIGLKLPPEYNFLSEITLDRRITALMESPKRYFSNREIKRIKDELTLSGFDVESFISNETNFLGIKVDNLFFKVDLGPLSIESHARMLDRDLDADNKLGRGTNRDFLRNTFVHLYMSEQENSPSLVGDNLIPLVGENEFLKRINVFSNVVQGTVKSFYSAFGVIAPDKRIILTAPVEKDRQEKKSEIFVARSIKTTTSFDSIAGQSRAVTEAKKLVLAINHPEVYEKRGVKTPKGILFYGPPGTGKTLIAKAIASEINAELFEVSFSDIGSKWYGESEQRIQQVFDNANKVTKIGRKAIILFDELDSMAPSRNDAYEGSKKIVSIMLQNLDGFRSNKDVLIVGTTNRPGDIDPALKRPGRIDKIIEVGLPDLEDRKAILQLHIDKAIEKSTDSHDLFSTDLDIQRIAESTDGMSGADLANILNLTLESKTVLELEGLRWTPVTNTDIERTLIDFKLKQEEKRKIGFN